MKRWPVIEGKQKLSPDRASNNLTKQKTKNANSMKWKDTARRLSWMWKNMRWWYVPGMKWREAKEAYIKNVHTKPPKIRAPLLPQLHASKNHVKGGHTPLHTMPRGVCELPFITFLKPGKIMVSTRENLKKIYLISPLLLLGFLEWWIVLPLLTSRLCVYGTCVGLSASGRSRDSLQALLTDTSEPSPHGPAENSNNHQSAPIQIH